MFDKLIDFRNFTYSFSDKNYYKLTQFIFSQANTQISQLYSWLISYATELVHIFYFHYKTRVRMFYFLIGQSYWIRVPHYMIPDIPHYMIPDSHKLTTKPFYYKFVKKEAKAVSTKLS